MLLVIRREMMMPSTNDEAVTAADVTAARRLVQLGDLVDDGRLDHGAHGLQRLGQCVHRGYPSHSIPEAT